jgi:hypothetical protein
MQQTKPFAKPFAKLVLLLALVGALALAGCGGDDAAPVAMPPDPPPTPAPTPYETATAAIAAAETPEAAQAAYDAVKDDVTATQGESLQTKVDARIAVLDMMDRVANQKMALMTAAGMIDTSDLSTQALVDAARTAIAGLRQALADAVDVSEADSDRMMYMSMLTTAVGAVDMAEGGIKTATRRMNQMTALSDASMDLQAALTALSGSTPTQAQLDAASMALADLNAAMMGGADLTDTEKAPYVREAANAAAPIQTAQMAFDDAEDDAEDAANEAMAATAAKLYAGIRAQMGDGAPDNLLANDRDAGYDANGSIWVSIGGAADPAGAVITLSEDEDTMVADNHGWEGKRYTDPAGGDMVEAIVYSNVKMPTEGRKFGSATPGTGGSRAFEYTLNADGALTANEADGVGGTGTTFVTERVAFTGVTRTAGTEPFELPDPNRGGQTSIIIPGSYHGVSGTYYCTPAATSTCASQVAATGFALGGTADDNNEFTAGGGTWTFKPSDRNARVMDAADTDYASYGWWLHKTEDEGTFTASAFTGEVGTVADASDLNGLNGTATYMGGAAGKYALSSSTGGTNDAGHFTARAALEANFTNNEEANAITGTIDQFIGADGETRDWSVKLNGSTISDTGSIGDTTSTEGTEWTIGGTAAADSGQWSGGLRNNGDDGVPQVATGTFYSEYGTAGNMVGAFGADKQ